MIIATLLLMAQPDLPAAEPEPEPTPLTEKEAEAQWREIAMRAASSGFFLGDVIYDDPKMRKEIHRIGFANGCSTIVRSYNETFARHADALLPVFVAATRKAIPAIRLRLPAAMNSTMFGGRITNDVAYSGHPAVAAAQGDMRKTFLGYSKMLPKNRDINANRIKPKSDLAKALAKFGNWKLDKSHDLRMACVDQTISPTNRPTITTEDRPK